MLFALKVVLLLVGIALVPKMFGLAMSIINELFFSAQESTKNWIDRRSIQQNQRNQQNQQNQQ